MGITKSFRIPDAAPHLRHPGRRPGIQGEVEVAGSVSYAWLSTKTEWPLRGHSPFHWIPAYAGMTIKGMGITKSFLIPDAAPYLRHPGRRPGIQGEVELAGSVSYAWLSTKNECPLRGHGLFHWVPACAGMTGEAMACLSRSWFPMAFHSLDATK